MKWEGREQSENVEDRRGLSKVKVAGGGSLLALVVYIAAQFLGADPEQARQVAQVVNEVVPQQQQQQPGGTPRQYSAEEQRQDAFSRIILKDTEEVWTDIFAGGGQRYQKPVMVLYSDQVRSACGDADASVGPFYCPGDARVYIDLSFYTDMEKKLGAPGDFARAYVIAHEVGHHVQHLLGYSARANENSRRGNPIEINHASVRLELQADYLAGVWAHHAQQRFHYLEPQDVPAAMNAARQIGDDRLQMKAHRTVNPDSFTHGSSEQRQRWFMQGFKTGDVNGAKALFDLPYNDL